jgi:hypothetical protein
MTTVVVVASLVLTVYLELSSKENIMTFKKIAIIVAIVIATVTMLPVIIPVQLSQNTFKTLQTTYL